MSICVCISTTLGILLKYNFNFLVINLILPPHSHYSILSVNSISDILKANFLAEVCKIARKIWKQPLILSVLHCHYYISWPSDAVHLWDWGKLAETHPRAASSSSKGMEVSFTALSFEDVIPSLWEILLWFYTVLGTHHSNPFPCLPSWILFSFLTPKIFLLFWNLISSLQGTKVISCCLDGWIWSTELFDLYHTVL